jgi:putative tricarboxylic transport membrane protein
VGALMPRFFKSSDFWSGMALAALGAWIIARAWQWEYLGADGPGAGFFPLWYGIAMLVLALALAGTSVFRRVAGETKIDWLETRHALCVWAALAVAIASFLAIGFVIGFALLCIFIVTVIYRRSLACATVIALCLTAGFYLVFAVALGVALPTGLFGF